MPIPPAPMLAVPTVMAIRVSVASVRSPPARPTTSATLDSYAIPPSVAVTKSKRLSSVMVAATRVTLAVSVRA